MIKQWIPDVLVHSLAALLPLKCCKRWEERTCIIRSISITVWYQINVNINVHVWYPREFSRLHNLQPWYWNSLLYVLISSGKKSAHFLQLMLFTILQLLSHEVPITVGWAEAVWNEKFARHFYTWPAVGIEPQTFWSWVQHPIHLATCSHCKCVLGDGNVFNQPVGIIHIMQISNVLW